MCLERNRWDHKKYVQIPSKYIWSHIHTCSHIYTFTDVNTIINSCLQIHMCMWSHIFIYVHTFYGNFTRAYMWYAHMSISHVCQRTLYSNKHSYKYFENHKFEHEYRLPFLQAFNYYMKYIMIMKYKYNSFTTNIIKRFSLNDFVRILDSRQTKHMFSIYRLCCNPKNYAVSVKAG